MQQTYLLDTNFFIEAHRATFPFDVVPGFWVQVKRLAAAGAIWSIDKVYDEICRSEDELKNWIETELPDAFFKPSHTVLNEYRQVVNWAVSQTHYTQSALFTFLQADEADAWLVAHALQQQCPIVTHEVSRPEMKRAIKIPEPCKHFGLRFLNSIALLRELGVRI